MNSKTEALAKIIAEERHFLATNPAAKIPTLRRMSVSTIRRCERSIITMANCLISGGDK